MRITVVGTGYVGLVTGTCLAESGNNVTCVDIDAEKISQLQRGQLPIYEPGLAELVDRNLDAERLVFSTSVDEAVPGARCIFIAVGTPQRDDGSADLTGLWNVADALAPLLEAGQVIVVKSTVPVGTCAELAVRLKQLGSPSVHVASNPEFLKEGAAVTDFTKPDRIVVGVREPEVGQLLHELYAPFLRTDHPFLVMSPESAEMTKYVANALLATKISFINEMANVCEYIGADINDVRRGIGHDKRIGFAFLFPGAGYGGSCFPKDVRALLAMSQAKGIVPHVMQAVDRVNEAQKQVLYRKIQHHFDDRLEPLTVAIWGLAFKPLTDDIREAPALKLIDELLARNVRLRVHDPVAMDNVKQQYGQKLTYCDKPYAALDGADGLAIVTEWNEFRNPDFQTMRRLMRQPVIFDGRNLYEPEQMSRLGFVYYGVGRSSAHLVPT